MRILEMIFTYPPEVFIARHIKAMRENGLEPILVALDERLEGIPLPASIRVGNWDLGKVHIPVPSNKPLKKYTSLRYLVKPHTLVEGGIRDKILGSFIESQHPDLIHFHMGTLAGYLYNIPKSLKIPYTISLRGSDVQVKPYESQEKLLEGKLAIEGAAGIHAVSDALWKQAIETFELLTDNIFQKTIYTTVPLEGIKPKIESRRKKTFVAVGRFHWTRSYPMLLIAFKKYCLASPDSELLIIGDGELRDCLNYWIRYLHLKNNVHLLGKMNYSGIAEVILQADAFIQSSIAEGFSNATAEAMALGCPIFATDVGGTSEIIQDGVNGFLLDPISPDSWVKKFQLVNNEPMMKSIGENARKTAVEKFSSTTHAEEFKKFFKNAIENAK